MDPLQLIDKYYVENNRLKRILLTHSQQVTDKALWMVDRHPELAMDRQFVYEAAMIHDIGIFLTDAIDIDCHGPNPYICHGYLGAELMRAEGLPRHALVCERHTGAGITLAEIERRKLPIPRREMVPISLEEQLICFADKFYSKTRLDREKTIDKARKSVAKHGDEGLVRFDRWCAMFL